MANIVRNSLHRGLGSSGLELTMHRWCAVGSLLILMTIFPLAGIARGAVPEASVTWHEVGEGVWDLLGVSQDHKTAYLIHDLRSAIEGNKDAKVAYRLLAVDLTSLKITQVAPTKVVERDRYLIIVVNRQHFFVARTIAYLSPDKTKVAMIGEPYLEGWFSEPSEKIYLLDLNTLSEKLINAQNTVQGYSKQAMYARAGSDADPPPTWALPRGWLSNHEILYSSERTRDGESLWLLDIRNKSERLLLKMADLEKKWEYPVNLSNMRLIDSRRLLLSGWYDADDIAQYNVTDLRGKILDTLPSFSSGCLAPDGKKVILTQTSSKTGGTIRLPPVVRNLNTGLTIPLPQALERQSSCHWFWREDGSALATFLYSKDDLSKAVLTVMELDGATTLKTITTDLSKGLFNDFRDENQVGKITWLDRTHLLLTTVKAQPYFQVQRRELTTWILTLR